MRLSVRLNLCLIFAVGGTSLAFALYQAQNEMHGLRRDLDRQSAVLAESLEKSAEPLVAARSYRDLQRLADRFKDHERLAGVAFYDADRPAFGDHGQSGRAASPAARGSGSRRQTGHRGGRIFQVGRRPDACVRAAAERR